MSRPWENEPNEASFEADGLQCRIVRAPLGHLCGYVGVPSEHPWFGLPYNALIKPTKDMLGPRDKNDFGPIDLLCAALSGKDIEKEMPLLLALRVHGGVTWANDHCPDNEDKTRWWFGFDCAHAGDLSPETEKWYKGTYRTLEYVVAECQSLAVQLVKIMEDAKCGTS